MIDAARDVSTNKKNKPTRASRNKDISMNENVDSSNITAADTVEPVAEDFNRQVEDNDVITSERGGRRGRYVLIFKW